LVEEGTLYRGKFDGGYDSFYAVLNLVLILFCQDIDLERFKALVKGKGKNNRIPIMLIGQGRGGKSSLMNVF
jgi:hypothetical protein